MDQEQQSNSNEVLIYETLLEIKGDIGSIKSDIGYLRANFNSHVDDDNKVEARVTSLEATRNQQIGKASVWTLIIGAIGSVLGVVVSLLWEHYHR